MNNLALVIEDDVDLANIFAEAVKAAGFEIEIIRDGLAAQSRLKKEIRPSIILLDLHLPHVDGAALFSQVRSDPALEGVTVIIATADNVMGEIYREQADFVLIKPISFMQLRDLTSRLKKA